MCHFIINPLWLHLRPILDFTAPREGIGVIGGLAYLHNLYLFFKAAFSIENYIRVRVGFASLRCQLMHVGLLCKNAGQGPHGGGTHADAVQCIAVLYRYVSMFVLLLFYLNAFLGIQI